jgi:hypothetical protein
MHGLSGILEVWMVSLTPGLADQLDTSRNDEDKHAHQHEKARYAKAHVVDVHVAQEIIVRKVTGYSRAKSD